jgi:hypothetical protein
MNKNLVVLFVVSCVSVGAVAGWLKHRKDDT